MALDPGFSLAGYVVEYRLGAGGMGEVYRVRHPRLPRSDALKVLAAGSAKDPAYRQRFEREADLAAQLSHPNIVKVHDRGEFEGQLWIALELIDGPDLAEVTARSAGGLTAGQVGAVATAVATALDYAHGRGLLHRDVKPANVMINSHGRIMLADFGIARLAGDDATSMTSTGMTLGTVSYSSPEQLHGRVLDGRSDQYSLACTVFDLLTGHRPFESSSPVAVISAHLVQPVPSLRQFRPDLGPAVDGVIGRAMAKEPQARFASCGEFAAALVAALSAPGAETATSAPNQSAHLPPAAGYHLAPQALPTVLAPQPPSSRTWRKWWWAAAGVALVTVVAIAVGALVVFRGGGGGVGGGGDAGGVGKVRVWDDTLYPREIASLRSSRLDLTDKLLDVGSPPKLRWTAPITGQVRPVGGNDDVVIVAGGSQISALSVETGALRWPFVDLQSNVDQCAIIDNRIACIAGKNGSDSTLSVLNIDDGQVLHTVKIANRNLTQVRAVRDRFVATTGYVAPNDKGFAVGFTTEGDRTWERESTNEILVMAAQQLLVDGTLDSAEIAFLSTVDGREILTYKRPKGGDGQQFWDVFSGGIAVMNADWTGTDFYDLDGKKTASISGWEPAGYRDQYTNAHPLPLLTRMDEVHRYEFTANTLAAANPKTGHLLWRNSDPGIQPRRINTVEDLLIMQVSDPTDSGSSPGVVKPTSYWFRVFDCFTGEPKSVAINLAGPNDVQVRLIRSTGSDLISYYIYSDRKPPEVLMGFDFDSGARAWELPLGQPVYIGNRMYGYDDAGVSLYSW